MVEFIRLENSLEKAKFYRYSPVENTHNMLISGIQLLPNNALPYIQRTFNKEGIELEDFTVFIIDTCGKELADITGSFTVLNAFQDKNGKPQIDWKLENVNFDAGAELVMLKINQGFNTVYYSSYFKLTQEDSVYTSRWDYKNTPNGQMLSTQLGFYFRQLNPQTNVETYTTLSEGKIMNQGVVYSEIERWQSRLIDKNFFPLFIKMFTSRFVYCDLLRCGIPEAIEAPELSDVENFYETSFSITRDSDDTYDPLYIPYVPPVPAPPVQAIILDSLRSLNNRDVEYTFHTENFEPEYLTLQYAVDRMGPWQGSNTGSPSSPRINSVPGHLDSNFFFRIYHQGTGLASNVVELQSRKIEILSISATPNYFNSSGNTYAINFVVTGYTVPGQLSFEAATQLGSFIDLSYSPGNESPKTVITPFSTSEFTRFRIRDLNTGITSNTFNIEL